MSPNRRHGQLSSEVDRSGDNVEDDVIDVEPEPDTCFPSQSYPPRRASVA